MFYKIFKTLFCSVRSFAMQPTANAQPTILQGYVNRFNQVIINSAEQDCPIGDFPDNLQKSLEKWITDSLRSAWFNVHLNQAEWIPHLAKNGFTFHHAKPEVVAMVRCLKADEPCLIPNYAHNMIGIGGIVMNPKRQILAVSEKSSVSSNQWKLPGGYVEPGEDLDAAVEREIFEETGIAAKFKSLIGLRHSHKAAFECSDIYMVASLSLKSDQNILKPCPYEINAVSWIDVNDFINHPLIHSGNRNIVKKFLEYERHGIIVPAIKSIHPMSKKPITTYHIEFDESNEKEGASSCKSN